MNTLFNKRKLLSVIVSSAIVGVALGLLGRYLGLPKDNPWLIGGVGGVFTVLINQILPLLWKKRDNTQTDRLTDRL